MMWSITHNIIEEGHHFQNKTNTNLYFIYNVAMVSLFPQKIELLTHGGK
jgi:hypothetical protein